MTEVPVITEKEFQDNFDFIMETLVIKNKMTFRIITESGKSVICMPVLESQPLPDEVMKDLEELNKMLEQPDALAGPPPLDMPF